MVAFTRIEATIVSPQAGHTLHYDPTENGYNSFILVGFSDCGIPEEGRCKVPLRAKMPCPSVGGINWLLAQVLVY